MIHNLKTSTLLLRDFTQQDVNALFELYSLEETSKFESWEPHTEIQSSIDLLCYWVSCQDETPRTNYTLAIMYENQFIGLCGLELGFGTETDDLRVGFLGYRIHPKFWNLGLATEAASEMLRFAFRELELHRVHSGCTSNNTASLKVLEKLGFRAEGITRKSFPIENIWTDYKLFGMLKDDYTNGS